MKNVTKKVMDAVGLIADMAPAVMLIATGVALIVGGKTGVLWY